MEITEEISFKLLKRVKDKKFDINYLENYCLSIQIGIRDVQISITDKSNNYCLFLEDYNFENVKSVNSRMIGFRKLFDTHQLLSAGFWDSIKLSIKSHKFTLVPTHLFDESSAEDYLSLNSTLKENVDQVFQYENPRAECVNVFAADKKLVNWIKSAYPNKEVMVLHQGSAFIEGILEQEGRTGDKSMYCLVDRGILHVVVTKEDSLLYYNQFAVRKSPDYVKYILLVFKELKLSQKNTRVTFWGNISEKSPHLETVKKYIRNVALGDKPSFLSFGFVFDQIAEQRFFDTFSIYICV
ncbi:MAG TPA: DUF3822 family protein [Cyclobacteriaceae bacterium]